MRKETEATVLLLIGTLFWGMTFVFIKEGVSVLDVFTFLAWRFIIAGTTLAVIFHRKIGKINRRDIRYGSLLGAILAISFFTQTIGLQYTTASKAAFITGLSVVLIPLMIAIGRKQLPTKFQIFSVVLATGGLALLTLSSSFSINRGDLWVLACAFAFGYYVILVGVYTHRFDAILLALVQFFFIGFLSLLIAFVKGSFTIPENRVAWQAILFTALFATTFTYTVQNYYQKYVSEVKTAVIFSFEPLFAAVTAWIYLGEALTLKIIAGGMMIFIAMLISEIKK